MHSVDTYFHRKKTKFGNTMLIDKITNFTYYHDYRQGVYRWRCKDKSYGCKSNFSTHISMNRFMFECE